MISMMSLISYIMGLRWLPFTINTVAQNIIVGLAALLALKCADNASAARRHLIATAALGVLIILPIVTLVIPGRKAVLSVPRPQLTNLRIQDPIPSVPAHAAQQGTAQSSKPQPSTPETKTKDSAANVAAGAAAYELDASVVASTREVPSAHMSVGTRFSLYRVAPWLALLWLAGAAFMLGRLFAGMARVTMIARHGDDAKAETLGALVKELVEKVRSELPIRVILASQSYPVSVPMIWGIRRPTLLLPADAAQWPKERLRIVMLHELAHVRRYDWLTQTLSQIVCALYWFNPLVWTVYRHSQIEAERSCDDAVILSGVAATDYANCLIEIVRTMKTQVSAPKAAIAMARPKEVRTRIESIMNTKRPRSLVTKPALVVVAMISGITICNVAGFRPVAWALGEKPRTPIAVARAPQFASTDRSVPLANGVTVHFVAISSNPLGYGYDWWSADGKPILTPPEEAREFDDSGTGFAERYLRRSLYFRLVTDKDEPVSTIGYVVDPTGHLQTPTLRGGRSQRHNLIEIKASSPLAGTVPLGFPMSEKRCTYLFGVAAGPWETIAVTRLDLHPAPGAIHIAPDGGEDDGRDEALITLDNNANLSFDDIQNSHHVYSMLGAHGPLGEVARRVVAVDAAGNEISLTDAYQAIPEEAKLVTTEKLSRIAEFRLQIRPYLWAEFKDIPLTQPRREPPTIATPEALPTFRHRYSSGITVSVLAVAGSTNQGGRWWKPNGMPLAGTLADYEETVSLRELRKTPQKRLVAVNITGPLYKEYSQTEKFAPSEPADYSRIPGTETSIFPPNVDHPFTGQTFGRNLKESTLHYGIATGPWKSVAHVMLPRDVGHHQITDTPYYGELYMEFPAYPDRAERPKLYYYTTSGQSREVPFVVQGTSNLNDMARRFVAVDYDGSIVPFATGFGFRDILDSNGAKIPFTPADRNRRLFSRLGFQSRAWETADIDYAKVGWITNTHPTLVSIDLTKVREFQLQVRPYDWAEFKNIALQPARH